MAEIEKVKPNKFTNAWGTAALYAFVVGVPAGIINTMRGASAVTGPGGEAAIKHIKSPVTWILALAPAAAFVTGAFKGWGRSSKEANYITNLEQQNAVLINDKQAIATQVAAMNQTNNRHFGPATTFAAAEENAESPVSVETPKIQAPTPAAAPVARDAAELAESPVSVEPPKIQEPKPAAAPVVQKSFTENAPAPASEQGGHAAAVEASQHEAAIAHVGR